MVTKLINMIRFVVDWFGHSNIPKIVRMRLDRAISDFGRFLFLNAAMPISNKRINCSGWIINVPHVDHLPVI